MRVKLAARYGVEGLPAASTLGRMLTKAGLVRARRRRKRGQVQMRPDLTVAVPEPCLGGGFQRVVSDRERATL